jgi:hypothetical protein
MGWVGDAESMGGFRNVYGILVGISERGTLGTSMKK